MDGENFRSLLCGLVLSVICVCTSRASPDPLRCPAFVNEGEDFTCECWFETSSTSSCTFRWEGYPHGPLIITNVKRQLNGTEFVCRRDCGGQITTERHTLQVAYGSDDHDVRITGPRSVLVNGTENITLTIEVANTNPEPRYVWNVNCREGEDGKTCTFTPHRSDHGKNITCRVTNPVTHKSAVAAYHLNLTFLSTSQPKTPDSEEEDPDMLPRVIAGVVAVLVLIAVVFRVRKGFVKLLCRRAGNQDSSAQDQGTVSRDEGGDDPNYCRPSDPVDTPLLDRVGGQTELAAPCDESETRLVNSPTAHTDPTVPRPPPHRAPSLNRAADENPRIDDTAGEASGFVKLPCRRAGNQDSSAQDQGTVSRGEGGVDHCRPSDTVGTPLLNGVGGQTEQPTVTREGQDSEKELSRVVESSDEYQPQPGDRDAGDRRKGGQRRGLARSYGHTRLPGQRFRGPEPKQDE